MDPEPGLGSVRSGDFAGMSDKNKQVAGLYGLGAVGGALGGWPGIAAGAIPTGYGTALDMGEENDPYAVGANIAMAGALGKAGQLGADYLVGPALRYGGKALSKLAPDIPAGIMDDWMPGVASEGKAGAGTGSAWADEMLGALDNGAGTPPAPGGNAGPPGTGVQPFGPEDIQQAQTILKQAGVNIPDEQVPEYLISKVERMQGGVRVDQGGAGSNFSPQDMDLPSSVQRMSGGVQVQQPITPGSNFSPADFDLPSSAQRVGQGAQVQGYGSPPPRVNSSITNTQVQPSGTPATNRMMPAFNPEQEISSIRSQAGLPRQTVDDPMLTPGGQGEAAPRPMNAQPPTLGTSQTPEMSTPNPSEMDMLENSSGVWNQKSDLDRLAWWLAMMSGGFASGAGASMAYGPQAQSATKPPQPKAIQR
jgi:hypothetical protein